MMSVHYKGVKGMRVVYEDMGNGMKKPFLYVYGEGEALWISEGRIQMLYLIF